jgi:hypothetical protein
MRLCRSPILALLSGLVIAAALAQTAGEPVRAPLRLEAPIQDKNFYLLSLIERTPAAAQALQSEAGLSAVARRKREALAKAFPACAPEPTCAIEPFRFTPEESTETATALRHIYKHSEAVRRLVDGPLRQSGAYIRLHGRGGDDVLVAAWLEAAKGINKIIDVYGYGRAPRYPLIDSASFDVKSAEYHSAIHTAAGTLGEQAGDLKLFFQPSLRFALYLLEINKRDEAGRHEPLEARDNQAALRHLAAIRWERFPYTVIVVPGAGADRTTWNISPESKLRLDLAARRFKAGKAPLILVSGGYVHPNQTLYCEAIEMKKSLIADYGVPAEAILVDPHARHTTTNLRNAARLMFRYGIPLTRKALITTDAYQSAYIESGTFTKRCDDELGYRPHQVLGRVSAFDLEFLPRSESLQIDPLDPLDP